MRNKQTPHRRTTFRRNERGQTMVEFALVLPLLALLLFGVVQFAIVFNNYIELRDGVRAGARKAAVSRQNPSRVSETQQVVQDSAGDLSRDPSGTCDRTQYLCVDVASSWNPGEEVTVEATYPYSINLFGVVTVASGTLRSRTTERVE
jgi:Flp pilus assembly protein TadG